MGLPVSRFVAALLCSVAVIGITPTNADDGWNPFREKDERRSRARPSPADGAPPLAPVDRGVFDRNSAEPPGAEGQPRNRYERPWTQAPGSPPTGGSSTVERVDLAPLPPLPGHPSAPVDPAPPTSPVMPGLVGRPAAPAAPRLPTTANTRTDPGFWRGLDMAALEKHLGSIEIPPKSPALHALWLRLMTSDAAPPAGVKSPSHFPTLQLEGLYRIGALGALSQRLSSAGNLPNDRLAASFLIRRDLAANDSAAVCERVRTLLADRANLPKILLGEVQILSGYCAAIDGNPKAAGLAASLARDAETDAPLALNLLDAIALGADGPQPKLEMPKRLMLIEYRLMEKLGPVDARRVLPIAEPALIAALAKQTDADPRLKLAAADAAAAIHAVTGEDLAAAFDAVVIPAGSNDPVFRRAALFKGIKAEQQPARRQTLARQFLDDARKSSGAQPLTASLAFALGQLPPDLGTDAGIAVEIALAARDHALARRAAASPSSGPWLALAELADPNARGLSEQAFTRLEEAALRGRFTPEALHRLATILDAFDVNVPVPLWEAASRTPQPNAGHLPPTGMLPELDQAGRRNEPAHTALLAMRTLGPNGPSGAHLLALAESIRALRRAGLESEARMVAVEALLPVWAR